MSRCMDSRCKIGRVTFKDPKIKLLKPKPRYLTEEEYLWAVKSLEQIWEHMDNKCVCLVLVGVDAEGGFSKGIKLHRSAPFGETLLPSIVSDILRAKLC